MNSFEAILIGINDLMLEESVLAYFGSTLWGVLSLFLSPCHLASIPLLISYMAGQKMTLTPKHATLTALLFSLGLFSAIACIGCICAFLGTMFGDVPKFIKQFIGFILLILGLATGLRKNCHIPYTPLFTNAFAGYCGAIALGFLYEMLSGVCTFGFLAPILATITLQQNLLHGVIMTLCFAFGHCLPIILIGSGFSFFDLRGYQKITLVLKKIAALLIILFGLHFIIFP